MVCAAEDEGLRVRLRKGSRMKRLCGLLLAVIAGLSGCGGGGGGRTLLPANVAGKWVGTMDHDVNGEMYHYNVALVLFQEDSHVTGTMVLEYGEDGGHSGHIDGQMQGNHFTGTRTARHVVDIEFDVSGSTLVGTFTFVSPAENLDEHGTFTCTRTEPPPEPTSEPPFGSNPIVLGNKP